MRKTLTSRLVCTWMILAFAAIGISGSQCSRVDDRATGPGTSLDATDQSSAECIKACNDAAFQARRAEIDLFHTNMNNCTTKECKDAEAARHEAAMDQISADQEFCKAGCHEQGTGTGGQ